MATAFSRTWRSLRADSFSHTVIGIFAGTSILLMWSAWAFLAHITLHEVSRQSRLEVVASPYPIQSDVAGRVVVSRLEIGRDVRQGDVLLELENEGEESALQQQQKRLAAIQPEIDNLQAEARAQEHARQMEQQSSLTAITEAEERVREAEAPAEYAERDLVRLTSLRAQGLISDRDVDRGRSDAMRLRSIVDSAKIAVRRLADDQRAKESERSVQLQKITEQITQLKGDKSILESSLPGLILQVERRLVRAPITGRIGEAAVIQVGSFLTGGQLVGAVVPPGPLRIIADFSPSEALGKIRVGQLARMRLDGYPWAEYGAVQAQVTKVADEVRDGGVRVEFGLLDSPQLTAPLRHGLPGVVEVDIDQITPAQLLLRGLGRSLASPRSSQEVR